MNPYLYQSATELAEQIKQGKARSVDVVQAHLDQIKKYNNSLHALVMIFEQEALTQAQQCDAETAQGISRGPLHGVPVTVKESTWLKGKPCTGNFFFFRKFIPDRDALVVERLKKSGAIILGKTNLPRGLINYQVQGDLYPEGKNPYKLSHSPGGSSGGGAAAIASGMSCLELCSDLGGSIRIPSHFCGLYGLKPTENEWIGKDIFPRGLNGLDYKMDMGVSGLIARTAKDLALAWPIISAAKPSKVLLKDITQYTFVYTKSFPGYEPSMQTQDVITHFVKQLENQNISVRLKSPSKELFDQSITLFISLIPYIIGQHMPWIYKKAAQWYLRFTLLRHLRRFLKDYHQSFSLSFNRYVKLLNEREVLILQWEDFFTETDFLICPMSYGPAFKRGTTGVPIMYKSQKITYIEYVCPYVASFNASGHPAMNIPLGVDAEGLPIGIQLVGAYGSEEKLIHVANQIEAFTSGFVRPSLI